MSTVEVIMISAAGIFVGLCLAILIMQQAMKGAVARGLGW